LVFSTSNFIEKIEAFEELELKEYILFIVGVLRNINDLSRNNKRSKLPLY